MSVRCRQHGRKLGQLLGFGAGALAAGFAIFALDEPIRAGEFMWRETTRFSGGWHTDTSVKFGSDPSGVWVANAPTSAAVRYIASPATMPAPLIARSIRSWRTNS